ncbi:MAG: SSI family serine proteinase inhibitor [Actinomycetota bacterium]|nr:SSI family serine proteinase inhibitor [Actinomycetota bacterium]
MTPGQRFFSSSAAVIVVLASTIGTSGPSQATPRTSEVKVTMRWAPGLTDTWTLQCDPVGGTHPNRVEACAYLDGLAAPFAEEPTDMACTMVFSGPERARVVGQWRGSPVDARFNRVDSCATARWRTYRALLTEPGMVTLRGRVDLGPTCPVQRPGEDCETIGAPATVTATSGTRHRTVTSGTDGFSLRVHRGEWAFTADAGMHCPTVVVDARVGHKPAPVVISCDTGIRTVGRNGDRR